MKLSQSISIIVSLTMLNWSLSAHALTGNLKKIKESGVVTLGVQETSIPFAYLDYNQQHIGYSIDLCLKAVEAIKKELGLKKLKIEMLAVTSATRIPLIANNTISMSCGSATNNYDRQKVVSFAPTMFVVSTRLMVKKSSHIKNLEDMKGKNIVAISGSSNIKLITEINNKRHLGMNIIPAKDYADGFLMLETGRAAAYYTDDILLAGHAANSKSPNDYEIVGEPLSIEPYGIIISRDDPDFKKLVDKALSDLYKSDEIKKIYTKWFLSAIPPKGINLNVPISPELQAVFANPTDSGNPDDYIVSKATK